MYSKWNIATECETVEVDPHTCYTQSWPHPQLWPRGSPPRRSSQTLSTFLRSSTSSFRHHSQHNFNQNLHYHQHILHHDCDIIQRLYHQHNWKNNFDIFLFESPFALLSPSSLPPERCLGSPATNKWIITIHIIIIIPFIMLHQSSSPSTCIIITVMLHQSSLSTTILCIIFAKTRQTCIMSGITTSLSASDISLATEKNIGDGASHHCHQDQSHLRAAWAYYGNRPLPWRRGRTIHWRRQYDPDQWSW